MISCTQCGGEGRTPEREGDHLVEAPCYHCGTTGQISEELAGHDELGALAGWLACQSVAEERAARNEDPEGEDWAFCAAENMLTEYEYTQGRIWEKEGFYQQRINELPWQMQEDLRLMYRQVREDEDAARLARDQQRERGEREAAVAREARRAARPARPARAWPGDDLYRSGVSASSLVNATLRRPVAEPGAGALDGTTIRADSGSFDPYGYGTFLASLEPAPVPQAPPRPTTVVMPGEDSYQVARRLGTNIQALVNANPQLALMCIPGKAATPLLRAGDELFIPGPDDDADEDSDVIPF